LFSYFADELLQSASDDARWSIERLSWVPTLLDRYVRVALGRGYEQVLAEALALGFVVADEQGSIEMHPLLRTFLRRKSKRRHYRFSAALARMLIDDGRWDDAFTVVAAAGHVELLPTLFESALSDLLAQSRLLTLDRWIGFAIEHDCEFALRLLAEAETARRRAEFEVGEVRALQAATTVPPASRAVIAHAYSVAGECAHHDYRPGDALRHHADAERFATTPRAIERAIWGQFTAAIQLEAEGAAAHIDRLEERGDASADVLMRLACGRLTLASLAGSLTAALSADEKYLHLRTDASDPLVETSFIYRYAYTCVSVGRYTEALEWAQRGDDIARTAGLPFATAHLTAVRVGAMFGLRHLKRASGLLDTLEDFAHDLADPFEEANARALRARILLAEARVEEAASLVYAWNEAPTRLLRGETCALLALALAVLGEYNESRELAKRAAALTHDVQAQTLSRLTACVADLRRKGSASSGLANAEDLLLTRGNFDSLVCAYRAYPPLLSELCRRGTIPIRQLTEIVVAANDTRLAKDLNINLVKLTDRPHLLSRRERDVYELMCRGLTNREIAQQLFISEVTAKVHVKHIMLKLNARSRTEAVLKAYHG